MSLLLSCVAFALTAGQSPAVEPRLLRYPDIHGDTVAFTYAGDLWIADTKGGPARRLTTGPGPEVRAKFSPDGKWIAFTGTYDGNPDVYIVPVEGGEPQRLTYEPDGDEVINWTPDGKVMYTSTYGFFSGKQRTLYLVDPKGGLPTRTVLRDCSEGEMTPDGNSMVYSRGRSYLFTWRRYRGGTQGKIAFYDFKNNTYKELQSGREQNYFPMLAGDSVYYISDRNLGTLNLYRYDRGTGKDTQLTQFSDADIRFPSSDGKTIVYERDGYLYAYDIAGGDVKKLTPEIRSDLPGLRPTLRKLGGEISNVSISPSGNRVAVEARGEVFTLPAKTGETRNLSQTSGAREQSPAWSPDGKNVAYISDRTGETEVYLQPQMGGDAVQLTSARMPITNIEWSPDGKFLAIVNADYQIHLVDPTTKKLTRVNDGLRFLGGFDISADGKWIAYSANTPNYLNALYLYEVGTGKTSQVTTGNYHDVNPAFDVTGKNLYFVSNRSFNPAFGTFEITLNVANTQRIYTIPLSGSATNPLVPPSDEEPASGAAEQPKQTDGMTVDLENIGDRAVPLPMPPASYSIVAGLKDGILYVGGGQLSKFDLATRESTSFATLPPGGGFAFSLNPARTKAAYFASGPGTSPTLGVVDLKPGIVVGQGRVDTNAVEAIIDPRKEWRQIYWEAWRYERDFFYDPNMRGLDWQAIGHKYEKLLPHVAHRSDLDYVLGGLLSELGTGHAYVNPAAPTYSPVPVGMLGADYRIANGRVQIAKVLDGDNYEEGRRGPLGEPGVKVKEGDYLLAIDGEELKGNVNPHAYLIGKVGRVVTLTVNDRPAKEGARTVRVRPVSNESNLRYAEFVEERRRMVDRLSDGKVGYMHVPSTGYDGFTEFVRGFYSQGHKQALLVDERWNNGGFTPYAFVEALKRQPGSYMQQRHGYDEPDRPYVPGPKAILVDQYAGSGGDNFPHLFRKEGVGPLIGMRTWGGLVGIRGFSTFVDGGGVSAPEFAFYDPSTNEIIAENRGIDPDIEVDARPDLVAQGRDPQLEKGVEYLLGELKKRPLRQPRRDIPRLGKEGVVK